MFQLNKDYTHLANLSLTIKGTLHYSGAMSELFKDRLKRWRGKLRQKEAAEVLGVPLETLRKWEYGKRTPKQITLCEIERRMEANSQ